MKIKNFTDLVAWQEAHRLVLDVYKLTEKFPSEEKFGLTNQIRRAVVSVTSNISEGFSRNSAKEKSQFYRISLGSLAEVQNHTIVAKDLKYISSTDLNEAFERIILVNKLLRGLLKSSTYLTRAR